MNTSDLDFDVTRIQKLMPGRKQKTSEQSDIYLWQSQFLSYDVQVKVNLKENQS